MDDQTWYCRRADCQVYGQVGPRARLKFRDWHRQAARYGCQACGQLISARAGTAYVGVRTDLRTYLRGATALAEGLSIRATGRLLGGGQRHGQSLAAPLGPPRSGRDELLLPQLASDRVPVG